LGSQRFYLSTPDFQNGRIEREVLFEFGICFLGGSMALDKMKLLHGTVNSPLPQKIQPHASNASKSALARVFSCAAALAEPEIPAKVMRQNLAE
jgi:hypothetical protein